ncbi:hypothetical protein NIES4074_16860 [Cylindrospermum sp. NIES-4074]|nr:hypothetical protein NIES4074_16860 [Cylindrospermum sp. NIES-4074]
MSFTDFVFAVKESLTFVLKFIFRDVLGFSRFGFFVVGIFMIFLSGYSLFYNLGKASWVISILLFCSGIILISMAIKGDKGKGGNNKH